jgi:hypothetical protein
VARDLTSPRREELIWQYDAKTLAGDLSAHLAYGASTGVTFWLLAKILWVRGAHIASK